MTESKDNLLCSEENVFNSSVNLSISNNNDERTFATEEKLSGILCDRKSIEKKLCRKNVNFNDAFIDSDIDDEQHHNSIIIKSNNKNNNFDHQNSDDDDDHISCSTNEDIHCSDNSDQDNYFKDNIGITANDVSVNLDKDEIINNNNNNNKNCKNEANKVFLTANADVDYNYLRRKSEGILKHTTELDKIGREGKSSITSLPIWSKNSKKISFAENDYGSTNSGSSSGSGSDEHSPRRLSSTGEIYPDGRRRDSMRTIFFGSPTCNRRFSQDLRMMVFPDEEDEIENETTKVIFFQVFIPFLIAGFGNVATGVFLDLAQHWIVFKRVDELIILISSFIGFKGNLEMTLAARLSTLANLGQMDTAHEQLRIAYGNIALVQCQTIVVGFLASLLAIVIDSIKELTFNVEHSLLLCATSLLTASITGLCLSALMVFVVIVSRKIGVNPDNVSTLIAAFLGDITAVTLLAFIAAFLYDHRPLLWLAPSIIGIFFVILLPFLAIIAKRNEYTKDIIGNGWLPIIIAMIISTIGGYIFNIAVKIFETIIIFQPIVNGIGSNLVAVQISRISTYFHQRCELGEPLPTEDNMIKDKKKFWQSPFRAFIGSNPNVQAARLLLLMAIPGQLIYLVTIRLIKIDEVIITGYFIFTYLAVTILQVSILLHIAHHIVPFLWRKKIDPDNAAIPAVMAFGDLIGTALLTIAFIFLSAIEDPNASAI